MGLYGKALARRCHLHHTPAQTIGQRCRNFDIQHLSDPIHGPRHIDRAIAAGLARQLLRITARRSCHQYRLPRTHQGLRVTLCQPVDASL